MRPPRFRLRGGTNAGQRLHRLAVSRRVADARVSRERFDQVDRPFVRPAQECALNASMLIPERDFKVKDLFAVALEPKMSGLDHPRMDRSHGNFMDLLPFN